MGKAYANIMRARENLYRCGVFDSWRPPVPCISVGNLCVGGTGKTPVCEWLLNWSLNKGKKPALLTRGYKGRGKDYPYLVTPQSNGEIVGDEPLMLASSCPDASVVVDPKRNRGGKFVLEKEDPDLFILDDGFQHIAVQRDLDLVLLKPKDLTRDWNRVLPFGFWREGQSALHRASAFILDVTNVKQEELTPWIEYRLKCLQKPVFVFNRKLKSFTKLMDGTSFKEPFFDNYLLVSAVGDPDKVLYNATKACGKAPREHLVYSDHHRYSRDDFANIKQKALQVNAQVILCTAKDGVKLKDMTDETVYVLDVDIEFQSAYFAEQDFAAWLDDQLAKAVDWT